MTFQKGISGNPEGNRDRKLFVDALHSLISLPWDGKVPELPKDGTKKIAHALAHRLVKEGMENTRDPKMALQFIQEICDRAYGKPKQALTAGDEDDKPLFPEKIEIILVKPNAASDT